MHIGLIFAVAASQQTSFDLATVPELAEKVSVHQQFITLREFVKTVKEATHSSVNVATGVPDLKLDVFVTELPASAALNGAAKVLGLRWAKEGKSLYLLRYQKDVDAEAASAQDSAQAIRAFQRDLEAGVKSLGSRNRKEIKDLADEIITQYQLMIQGGDAQSEEAKSLFRRYQLAQRFSQETEYAFLEVMRQNNDLWPALWGGRTVIASSRHRLPSHQISKLEQVTFSSAGETRTEVDARALFWFDPAEREIGYRYKRADEQGNFNSSTQGVFSFGWIFSPQSKVMAKTLSRWEVDKKDPIFDFELKEGKPSPSPWFHGVRTLGDHWGWMHDQSKVNVIAESFRRPAYWSQLGGEVGSLRSWLTNFSDHDSLGLFFENNVLLATQSDVKAQRAQEPPESAIRELEQSGADHDLILADYAKYAYKATDDQLGNDHVVAKVPVFTSGQVQGTALRLFASLGPSSQSALISGQQLPPKALSTESQNILAQLLQLLPRTNAGEFGGEADQIWEQERLAPTLTPDLFMKLTTASYGIGMRPARDQTDRGVHSSYESYSLTATKFLFGRDDSHFVEVAVMAPMSREIAAKDRETRASNSGSKG